MENRKFQNTLFALEVALDKLSALYSLFAAEYIDNTEPLNKARIESRGAIGYIIFDLISEAQLHGAALNAVSGKKEVV